MPDRAAIDEAPASGQRFVFPADAQLTPVAQLPVAVRNGLQCDPDDFVLDRPRQRSPSKLISAHTARLLQEFRTPKSIVEAVVTLSRELGEAPMAVLDAAFPAIARLVDGALLAPADPATTPLTAAFAPGERLGPFTIVRTIRALEDTAVCLAQDGQGTFVALKTATIGDAVAEAALEREAAALERVASEAVPALLAVGEADGVAYLAMRWIEGLPIAARADEIRRGGHAIRERLLALCVGAVEALARIHEAGVLHGDVKSSNLLVDREDAVHVIDFGMAALDGETSIVRSWSFESLEPEAARRMLEGETSALTQSAEQFAIAALIYRLASGHAFRTPPSRQEQALVEIAGETEVRPFTVSSADAWPELEHVLRRALASHPGDRYPDIRSLASALRSIPLGVPKTGTATRGESSFVDDMLDGATSLAIDAAERFSTPPTASAHAGAAGLAWFLYRAAQIRGSGALLAHADRWARVAVSAASAAEGLEAPQCGISAARARRSSPLHDVSGPVAVRCLIASARQDKATAESLAAQCIDIARQRTASTELFLGNAGHLALLATLHDALRGQRTIDCGPLEEALMLELTALAARMGDAGPDSRLPHLGMAHGWAGLLYAVLTACRQIGSEPAAVVADRLSSLAASAEPIGRGFGWLGTLRCSDGPTTPAYAPGWCSGSAGHVMLWAAAFEQYRDPRFRELATKAGWHAWEHPDASASLCCGRAGRALGLLRLYRLLGDPTWLERARSLVEPPELEAGAHRYRLFRGDLGPALVALELERPAAATMPFLEPEGWSC